MERRESIMLGLKITPATIWKAASFVLGIAGMAVSNKVDANNRIKLKEELKEEIVKELTDKMVKGS
jgi:hypothetical protein